MRTRLAGWVAVLAFACGCMAAMAKAEAASIGAGGLVARGESRIVLAKQVLLISPEKVAVDYQLRNDTQQDVTLDVGFQVPAYKNEAPQLLGSEQAFTGSQALVEGKPQVLKTETRATLGDDDVTALLGDDQVDIASFGRYERGSGGNDHVRDWERLSADEQDHLVRLGLFDNHEQPVMALWTVHTFYYWQQRFPAHSTVHIRLEYTPVGGHGYMENADQLFAQLLKEGQAGEEGTAPQQSENATLLAGFCPDRNWLAVAANRMATLKRNPRGHTDWESAPFEPRWVDFQLTTANSWRMPIEDFTLIVERGKTVGTDWEFSTGINFCALPDTKVERLSDARYRLHIDNFTPASDLHIGFFDLPAAQAK